ncbi:hypothetical protein N9267_00375 [bacterium]|nr:hypothetical protein [bacterium]
MTLLQMFFGENTSIIHVHLRNRRGLRLVKGKLEAQQRLIAKRIRNFEQKHEAELRLSRSRLHSSQTTYDKAATEESHCWNSYHSGCSRIENFVKCIQITIASLFSNTSDVSASVHLADKLAFEWQMAFQALLEAELELKQHKSHFQALAAGIESDRFAIQALSKRIMSVERQLQAEENAITHCIKKTAQHMSQSALARKQMFGRAIAEPFYRDVRELRRLLNRINAFEQIARNQPKHEKSQKCHELLETVMEQSFVERKLPLTCRIPLKGRGIVARVDRNFADSTDQDTGANNRRVFIGDKHTFHCSILQRHWKSDLVSDTVSFCTTTSLSESIADSTKTETGNIIQRLETEANAVSRRLSKSIFTGLSI